MQFNKDILKQAYDEELRHFRISPNGTNAIKQLLDQIDDMTRQGRNQLTKEQLLSVIAQTNMFTTADIVAYCLQTYYDQHDEKFDINESLYSSGIERTSAYFDDAPCLPAHSDEVTQVDYIENVLFKCFSSYMEKKGYRELVEIYRYMIRFGCILNPRSNIIVLLFNNLSNDYFLQSPNLDEGSYEYTDQNMFTGQRHLVNLSSKMYSQITKSSYYNVTGQPLFILTIDYGNIITLDARPYTYVLQALFYMRDKRVNDYEGTKIRIIQGDIEREQQQEEQQKEEEAERQRQQKAERQRQQEAERRRQQEAERQRQAEQEAERLQQAEENEAEERREQREQLREQLRKKQVMKNWFESRLQLGTQGGGRERRIKSKKNKKVKVNKKTHYSRNKSRRHRRRRKSAEKR